MSVSDLFYFTKQQTNVCQHFNEDIAFTDAFFSDFLDVGVDFALSSGHAFVEVGLQLVDQLFGVSFPL